MKPTFTFISTSTKSISATTTSAAVELDADGDTLLLTNAGEYIIFVEIGGSTVAAATTGLPILPGTAQTINRGAATHLAARTGSSTGTLYISTGYGV